MGLKTENPKSWSVAKYIVAVLWMEGRLGPADIARQVSWTTGQVRGFYNREFDPPRVTMTKAERQAVLEYLKGWSNYFSVFVEPKFEDRFRAKELRGERMLRLKEEARARDRDDPKEMSKKDLRKLAEEEAARRRQEDAARLEREFGYAPRGAEVDALGWLYLNALGDKQEALAKGAMLSRDRRREALLKFRTHLAGRSVSPLQAQDYEAVGGGGGVKIALPEFRKFCIDTIGGIRDLVPVPMFQMLETVVEQDEFVWLRAPKGPRRAIIYESIRYATDILAVYYLMMGREDFEKRWGEALRESTPASRSAARADSAQAQQTIDQLTKAVA